MQAVTIRKRSDNTLICFGPDNNQYDPVFDVATMVRNTEPDFSAVITEWMAAHPAPPSRGSLKTAMWSARSLPELVTALDALL
jgi:hypothetical protein